METAGAGTNNVVKKGGGRPSTGNGATTLVCTKRGFMHVPERGWKIIAILRKKNWRGKKWGGQAERRKGEDPRVLLIDVENTVTRLQRLSRKVHHLQRGTLTPVSGLIGLRIDCGEELA